MIIAEFTVNHPILEEPLGSIPDLELEWEQTFESSDGRDRMLIWATTEEFDRFESAVERDPGVANPAVVADPGPRRLYRFDLTETGKATNLYPRIVDAGGVLQTVAGSTEGWHFRVQFPDREALAAVHRFCQTQDIDFTLGRVFERTDRTDGTALSLTEEQRAALAAAVDSGYLEIPRDATLADLADSLGISESAASERLRRGMRALIQQTLPPDGE